MASNEKQYLRTMRATDGWFWYVSVPGRLAHSSGERYDTEGEARGAGLRAYPLSVFTERPDRYRPLKPPSSGGATNTPEP